MAATILAVARSPRHRFSKPECDAITLVEGLGVDGDAHSGVTVLRLGDAIAMSPPPHRYLAPV